MKNKFVEFLHDWVLPIGIAVAAILIIYEFYQMIVTSL